MTKNRRRTNHTSTQLSGRRRSLFSILSDVAHSKPEIKSTRRPRRGGNGGMWFESLESRVLLATLSFSEGVLTAIGSSADETLRFVALPMAN
ncbi:MAG: hypothetical protein R3C05_19200 [Pirellulaceae bacterium]